MASESLIQIIEAFYAMAFEVGNSLTTPDQFGRILAARRIAAGLTQEEVAESAEISVRALRNLELGVVTRPHRKTIRALVAALDIDEQGALVIDRYMRLSRVQSASQLNLQEPVAPPVLHLVASR